MITLVLDTSALLAYARLHGLAVSELVMLAGEADTLVGIPAGDLLEAHASLTAEGDTDAITYLEALVGDEEAAITVLALRGEDAVTVARLAAQMPAPGGAHAVIVSAALGVDLATYTRHGLRPPDSTVTLVEPGDR